MPPLDPTTAPDWLPYALFAAAVIAAAAAVAAAIGVWLVAARTRSLDGRAAALDRVEAIAGDVKRLADDRGDLDLRRVEHVLIELRDAQVRLEDALLRHAEATRGALVRGAETSALAVPAPGALGESAVNRLIALGYERVQLVTRSEKLAELGAKDGEILVEARRDGVLHKGRVLVRAGRIANVEMHPAYSIFP